MERYAACSGTGLEAWRMIARTRAAGDMLA
jgi:hypothetical protein